MVVIGIIFIGFQQCPDLAGADFSVLVRQRQNLVATKLNGSWLMLAEWPVSAAMTPW